MIGNVGTKAMLLETKCDYHIVDYSSLHAV